MGEGRRSKVMYATAIRQAGNPASPSARTNFEGQLVDAAEFRRLLISHRRLVRADRRADRLRGLQDLDTGEIFLIDERRLS
jgi:hypothetical protein